MPAESSKAKIMAYRKPSIFKPGRIQSATFNINAFINRLANPKLIKFIGPKMNSMKVPKDAFKRPITMAAIIAEKIPLIFMCELKIKLPAMIIPASTRI